MKLPSVVALVALTMTGLAPAQAAEWTTKSTTTSHSRSHCWINDAPSCWAT